MNSLNTSTESASKVAELHLEGLILDATMGQVLATSGTSTRLSLAGPTTWFDDSGAAFVKAFLGRESALAGPMAEPVLGFGRRSRTWTEATLC